MLRTTCLLALVSVPLGLCSCDDATGNCTYDADCPGIEICIDSECVPNRCPEVPCQSGEICVYGDCYLSDCPGVICGDDQVCLNGLCVDTTCLEGECQCQSDGDCPPGYRCDDNLCVRIQAGSPGAQTFTAGGLSLQSQNHRLELFVAPVCPTGDLQSSSHRLKMGPAAYSKPDL